MLLTDQIYWDPVTFEKYVDAMCEQIKNFPYHRVAFWAHSTPETVLTFFATWKLGKIACPLNFRLPHPPLDQFKTQLFTPKMPNNISSQHLNSHPFFPEDEHQTALLLFTSGSTGKPKIAQLSFKNLFTNATGSNLMIPLEPNDQWALTLPLFHVGGIGILIRCYLAKSTILLSKNLQSATHLSLVPTQLEHFLQNGVEFPNLKKILLGGAPIPDIKTPWDVFPTYGMTETASQIVTNHQIHPYAHLKIETDNEIWIKGDILFQGYLDHPRLNPSDWFPTGDLGVWNHGKFQILGRKDNMFISGGENIQPEEIESYIHNECQILEAIVVPIPHEKFGQVPALFLNNPFDLSYIQDVLKNFLPKYKIPQQAFQLPRNVGLKCNRKKLARLTESKLG